jgi:hypothetical protein
MPARKKKAEARESTIADLLSSYSGVEELKDEMCEWRDNMESANMTQVPKFEEVSEAADSLDNAYTDLESAVGDIENIKDEKLLDLMETKVQYQYHPFRAGRGRSRSDRLSDVCEDVRRAYDRLMELIDAEDRSGLSEDTAQEVRDALDSIEGALTDLEGVSFPGMF